MLGKLVTIGEIVYEEFINIEYSINFLSDFRDEKPPTEEDRKERQYILRKTEECIKKLQNDWNSRQACFVVPYDGENFGCCISTVHYLIRDDLLYCNVYYRSQNVNNLPYDKDTLILACMYVCDSMGIQLKEIHVRVGSYHSIYDLQM